MAYDSTYLFIQMIKKGAGTANVDQHENIYNILFNRQKEALH